MLHCAARVAACTCYRLRPINGRRSVLLVPGMHSHLEDEQHILATEVLNLRLLRYPFISIYFRQLGFSAPQIGFLFAIRPWITALTGKHTGPALPATCSPVSVLHAHWQHLSRPCCVTVHMLCIPTASSAMSYSWVQLTCKIRVLETSYWFLHACRQCVGGDRRHVQRAPQAVHRQLHCVQPAEVQPEPGRKLPADLCHHGGHRDHLVPRACADGCLGHGGLSGAATPSPPPDHAVHRLERSSHPIHRLALVWGSRHRHIITSSSHHPLHIQDPVQVLRSTALRAAMVHFPLAQIASMGLLQVCGKNVGQLRHGLTRQT